MGGADGVGLEVAPYDGPATSVAVTTGSGSSRMGTASVTMKGWGAVICTAEYRSGVAALLPARGENW